MPKKIDRSVFVAAAIEALGIKAKAAKNPTITRVQIREICDANGLDFPNWLTQNKEYATDKRGVYVLPVEFANRPITKTVKGPMVDNHSAHVEMAAAAVPVRPVRVEQATTQAAVMSYVPDKVRGYVPFGHFNDVRAIVKSQRFYPMFVTGLSGNGKTMMIDQVCAQEKRDLIRVNITIETDEDDLLGGFRLVDGKTVWHDGPVITAMELGAVLLLDEVDLGSNKLMCLQPVLEGKAVYLKKVGRVVNPKQGFNIIATANTKGKGSEDGRFIGTNVLNEAFLERFSITLEQEYPPNKVETKILANVLGAAGIDDKQFVDLLIRWADVIRKSFYDGAVSEIISTRRLVHICEAYAIFGRNREKAITLCLNRFDADTKNSFLDFYKKIDETISPLPNQKDPEEIAF